MKLRPYQQHAVDNVISELETNKSTLVVLPTGCHAKGQKVMLHTGRLVCVEDVAVGDELMGPDSTPRQVLQLCRGTGMMYRIVPTKGNPFVVNEDHILSLVRSNDGSKHVGSIVDVSVKEYLTWNSTNKHIHKLFRCPADFAPQSNVPLDPYFLGVLIGDGCCNMSVSITTEDPEIESCILGVADSFDLSIKTYPAGKAKTYTICGTRGPNGNRLINVLIGVGVMHKTGKSKFIPHYYKVGSKETRLQILAGLMDTDGSLSHSGYDYISVSETLSNDVAFIARSLGLSAYVAPCQKSCQTGAVGTYYRVCISGDCDIIPCRLPRKKCPPRLQKKSVLRTGFTVEQVGVGDYYGFVLDGDHRYLMDDFTVTHNSGKTVCFSKITEHFISSGRVMVIAHREELIRQAAAKIHAITGYHPAVEMASEWSAEDGFSKPKIVVSSVQTLCTGRVLRFDPNEFALLITDECFPAGTLVDGKPIETIEVGDVVKSFNHKTGQVEMKRVVTRMVNPASKLVSIYLSNGHKIVCTVNHPFWLVNHNEYMPARLLREGDRLTTEDLGDVVIERIFTKNCDSTTVYNIEVEDNHNYFANGILVHNCHHSTAASYSSVYAHMLSGKCKHLGVTATPDRADEQALGKVYQTVAYDYELPQIIADGWLVPIKQRLVTVTGLNYSNVKTTAGDLNQGDVAAAQANETILHEMIHPIVELAGTRKTIVFATPGSKKPTESDDGFHIAERMTEIINRYKPNSARRVSQDTPKDVRRQMLMDFADGKFQYLVNVGVLTEGFDDPSIEVVAITRPTKSRSLYAQMIGRGTRPLPGTVDQYEHAHERKHAIATSMKAHVEVLDFVGNSGRHKLVNTADILGGKYEQEVIDRAEKKAKEETVDMSEALQEAHDELKAEREKAKRARILAQTKFKVESVDPFDVFDIQPVRERQWDIGKPPTTAQLLALQKLGIPVVKDLSRSRAGQLLSEAYRRVDEGLVSFKQIAKGAKPDMKLTELNQDRFKNWTVKYQNVVSPSGQR